jgi:hypothetical protein
MTDTTPFALTETSTGERLRADDRRVELRHLPPTARVDYRNALATTDGTIWYVVHSTAAHLPAAA